MDTVSYALEHIGIERPTWQTLVVSAAREIDLPAGQLWNTGTTELHAKAAVSGGVDGQGLDGLRSILDGGLV